MLVLFDVDGTLLLTRGLGMASVRAACLELFQREFEHDPRLFSGSLDPLIWRGLCERNGVPDPQAWHDRFRATYARIFAERLRAGGEARLLPGARELVEALEARGDVTLGLLTGNYPETGRMKLAAAGLDPARFPVAVWGVDGPTRRDLPRVALQRWQALTGRAGAADRAVVVGDTPHDVDCARAGGCRALAVASGMFSLDELRACGPDLLVSDLTDTAALAGWIAGGAALPLPSPKRRR